MIDRKKLDEWLVDIKEQIENNSQSVFRCIGNFSEAKFNPEKRTVEVTVIKKGWSKNGFYYGDKALDKINEHINNNAKAVYLNHNPMKEIFRPRLAHEHIADTQRVWREGDEVKAEIKVFESGPNSWIFDRIKEAGSNYGPSIVGKAKVVEGEAEGKKGNIVEDVPWFYSYDVVVGPSAGGSVNAVYETTIINSEDLGEGELADKLKEKMKHREARQKMWDLEYEFNDLVRKLVCADGEYQYLSVKDRKAKLADLVDELADQLGNIEFAEPKEKPEESGYEQNKLKEGEDRMTLEELKLKHPELFNQVKTLAIAEVQSSAKVEQLESESKELKTLKEQHQQSSAKITELEKKVTTLETEKKDLKEQHDKLTSEKTADRMKVIISEVKKEVSLDESICSEVFNKELESVVFENEQKFKETIKVKCEDRKTLGGKFKRTPVINNAGAPEQKKNETTKVSESEKFPISTVEFVEMVKAY